MTTASGISVTVFDVETGKVAKSPSAASPFWWAEGNGSCDCNRELLFGSDTDDGTCLGCKRYVIVAIEGELDGYELAEFNDCYDEALVAEAMRRYAESLAEGC